MSTTSETSPTAPPEQFAIHRLERLADVIFAAALLMLLMTIDFVPEESSSAAEAYDYLWKNVSQNLGYAISFLVIAYYWMSHQEYFRCYTSTNKTHMFIELVYLMTIAGMPFNNYFMSVFPTQLAPRLAISSDIFAAGVLAFFSWSYATAGNRLINVKTVGPGLVTFMRRQALVMPVCAVVAAGAALLHPFAWDAVLFVGPLFAMLFLRKLRRSAERS